MHGIAMTEANGIEQLSVVIDGGRTITHLIAAVAIHVGHRDIMVAIAPCSIAIGGLAGIRAIGLGGLREIRVVMIHLRLRYRSMKPLRLQFRSVPVDRPNVSLGVIAATHHGTRILVGTVQIGHTSQETVSTVAVVVIPEALCWIGTGLVHLACAGRIVVDGVHGCTRHAVENSQIFRSCQHMSQSLTHRPGVTIVDGITCILDFINGSSLGDILALAVGTSRSSLANHLCLAVAVKVVDHELGVMGTGTDIDA